MLTREEAEDVIRQWVGSAARRQKDPISAEKAEEEIAHALAAFDASPTRFPKKGVLTAYIRLRVSAYEPTAVEASADPPAPGTTKRFPPMGKRRIGDEDPSAENAARRYEGD